MTILKYILFNTRFMSRYRVEFNTLFVGEKNKVVDYYDWSFIPEWFLMQRITKYLKDTQVLCINKVVYIERVNDKAYKKQYVCNY